MSTASPAPTPAHAPAITVTSGLPEPDELAVAVAVLLARTSHSRPGPADRSTANGWASRLPVPRGAAALPRPGPHGWRASARPR